MGSVMGKGDEGGGAPPPMDEAWWASLLGDDEHNAPPLRRIPVRDEERMGPHRCQADWAWARELYDTDAIVDLTVSGCNRGGLLVDARSLRGFVPVSHLMDIEPAAEEPERSARLARYAGRAISVKVIEYDPERGRLVFSERAAQAAPGQRNQLLATLEAGTRTRGVVTNITRFGVFLDLGGLEGLIHVSELSWGRVRHPADVVRCGQTLDVVVLSIDRDQGRVGLSLKETLPDPWRTVDGRYHVGDIVEGTVTNIVRFGAFIGIEEGLEGLIHASEMGSQGEGDDAGRLEEGDRVRARIIHVDAAERRLGLSLRQLGPETGQPETPVQEQAWQPLPAS
jgi:small subunit ribosomal protein S1